MLVLTRKTGQSITVGDPASAETAIEVKIIEIKGDQVRLGIQASKSVVVLRNELSAEKELLVEKELLAEVPEEEQARFRREKPE